nr:eukaryotic translation initiation factor 5B isoform X3 [Misgurnus anguillicaudatus]
MSQGKAKKKLLYHKGEDKSRSQIQINDVFTLRDIDSLFDDIDADSDLGLPVLSPLPKSSGVVNQKKSESPSDSHNVKTPSKKAPKEALIDANGIQDDGLIDKESPFKEIAPIKTSSPITLATEEDEPVNGFKLLLFGEDEEPIGGDLAKPPCTQQSEPVKEAIHRYECYSGSLESPPERLEFRKTTNPNTGSLSSRKTAKTRSSSVATQSAPLEIKTDSPMNEDPSQLSPIVVQNNEQKLQRTEQCMDQMVEHTGKRSSFQHKLKKALMPKSSCSRKPAAVPAPPPVDLEEDFMILDDEAPVLFVIPRKADVSRNKKTVQAKTSESVSAEPSSTEQRLQSEADVNEQQVPTSKRSKAQVESKKQPKGKRGKASKKNSKDAVTDVLEEIPNPVPEALEDEGCDQISSQTVQGLKDVDPSGVTGKQSSKDKAPDELPDKAGEESDSPEIPAPSVAKTTKKPLKSSGSQQKRRRSKTKKESNNVLTTAGPQSPNKNGKNSRKGEAVSKTNKRTSKQQKELENIDPVCEEHDSVEPSPALDQQEEEQRRAVTKQPSAKQDALKDSAKKQKSKETKRTAAKPKDAPPAFSDTSLDSSATSRRKRKPPGSWWLTGQDESATESQSETAQEQPKTSKTTTKKEAVEVSEETRPTQKKKKQLKSTRSEVENAEKVITKDDDAKKTAKKTGGRKKIRAAAQLQVPSPARVSEDEVGATSDVTPSEISPEFCSHDRQHNPITGEKQVFDKVYTRDGGSAQKHPSSSLRRPERSVPDDVPSKRQRKTPSNWWEVTQSEEPTNGPFITHSPPPHKSKTTTAPIGAFNKEPNPVKSQKTKNHTRNIIRTPKSIKTSLASMNAIFSSEKVNMVKSGQRRRKQGRRNILHSLEDQSDHSSENMANSDEGNGHVSSHFIGGIAVEPSATRNQSVRVSSGPSTLYVDAAFRSGPSSVLELQRHDEDDDDIDLPSSKVTPYLSRHVPRVLSQCDLCGPPLQTIVLEEEDWNNLQTWFAHMWPPASKGQTVSPDDFHWHSFGGRAMGHAVDLQESSFSHGKILLGSFMKKPPQMDIDTVSVFSIISSCVRVEIDGVKSVYNSGQVFMIPSGRVYSIHNLCQEPAVLIYHRTQSSHT